MHSILFRFADDGDSDPDKEEGIEAPGEEVGTGKTHEKPMVLQIVHFDSF